MSKMHLLTSKMNLLTSEIHLSFDDVGYAFDDVEMHFLNFVDLQPLTSEMKVLTRDLVAPVDVGVILFTLAMQEITLELQMLTEWHLSTSELHWMTLVNGDVFDDVREWRCI